MNQFRDILIVALLALAGGLGLTDPDQWNWAAAGGTYLVSAIQFLAHGRPWSTIILVALALALFMTRLKY